eukprot:scaffold111580_cov75-Phaeocystis_antarctica.AAC.2
MSLANYLLIASFALAHLALAFALALAALAFAALAIGTKLFRRALATLATVLALAAVLALAVLALALALTLALALRRGPAHRADERRGGHARRKVDRLCRGTLYGSLCTGAALEAGALLLLALLLAAPEQQRVVRSLGSLRRRHNRRHICRHICWHGPPGLAVRSRAVCARRPVVLAPLLVRLEIVVVAVPLLALGLGLELIALLRK